MCLFLIGIIKELIQFGMKQWLSLNVEIEVVRQKCNFIDNMAEFRKGQISVATLMIHAEGAGEIAAVCDFNVSSFHAIIILKKILYFK